jgi:S-adenosyl methyltransferase
VLAHARALLTSTPQGATAYIDADVRDPGKILEGASATLDFSKPVGVMVLCVTQYIADADHPHQIVSAIMDAMPSGSYLTMSDTTRDIDTERVIDGVDRLNARLGSAQFTARSQAEIARYFDGLEWVEPGLVPLPQWRALTRPGEVVSVLGGMGRKP